MRELCCSASFILLLVAGCNDAQARLVPRDQIAGDAIPKPLTGTPGDAEAGANVFASRGGGHCVLCHQVDGLDAPFQGNVGPVLTGVGSRLSPGQIRLRIVDYELIRPGVLMPSYYRTHNLYQVSEAEAGRPALPAQSVEDLVAYLSTLKD
ncbi:MAG: sulfur oxidation c-type cytochrome SoxX [Pseudomonadota bacterium]|uniref:sulfur oxidation c-type cytochrome SoxX n=1 Tax=Hyphomonas sp. BRH_c22 TaxID=1629710 RepID=UPI000AA197F6|nr:sulfur oxidation c-type cytochrome SoxX [Hyphomonas sp. BRH_c22]